LSRSGLCTGFKAIAGKSVYDYILDIHMRHAAVLLTSPGASISDVAHAVGYSHQSSFSAAVQKSFGVAPRTLRRRKAVAAVHSEATLSLNRHE
jgi:AraC family transcriptional activator of pyochelin receptor